MYKRSTIEIIHAYTGTAVMNIVGSQKIKICEDDGGGGGS